MSVQVYIGDDFEAVKFHDEENGAIIIVKVEQLMALADMIVEQMSERVALDEVHFEGKPN